MPARRTIIAAGIAVVALAGCSNTESSVNKQPQPGSGTATAVDGMQQITVTTGPDLRFHPSTLVVHRGMVRIVLRNNVGSTNGPPHNLQVTGLPGAYIPTIDSGRSAAVTFMAPAPGRYRFVCTIHEEQGQTGTLVVEPGTG